MKPAPIILAMLALAALFALFMTVNLAFADDPQGSGHADNQTHWYESACCNQRDCEPIPFEAVFETEDSYIVTYVSGRGFPVHAVVPRAKARHSQDGRFHGCAMPTRFLCLYVPSNS
jgi:hypothetical protein